ncbi:MAG: hypothetical protein ABSB28_05940 [Candidatus Bathyarchaeia archaeon]
MTKTRELTDSWAGITWGRQLSTVRGQSEIKRRIRSALRKSHLLNQNITGESVTGLKRSAEEQFLKGINISYSRAFNEASRSPEKLPCLFLQKLALNFDFKTASTEHFEGVMARGLRTFPSLLRERDFGENLERFIRASGLSRKDFSITVKPEEDIPQHTDVLLRFGGRDYRIWLYQFTTAGLPHDIERVLGRRGELPEGLHVLCPLKTVIALEKEKLERRLLWLTDRLGRKKSRYERYTSKECRGAVECRQESQDIEAQIKQTKGELAKVSVAANREICTINGWYFYSEQKVKRLLKCVYGVSRNKTHPDSYLDVRRILIGPEKYLGDIRFFLK